jgi:hypothetical protein
MDDPLVAQDDSITPKKGDTGLRLVQQADIGNGGGKGLLH